MSKQFYNNLDDLFLYSVSSGFGETHIINDADSGLQAIVAIHNTKLGPASGGCRFIEYDSFSDAMYDALRLAKGMSYKNALADLPIGGGKAVILKPKQSFDRDKLFAAFGKFINNLNGRYITALDSGTTVKDMDIISKYTKYVKSTSALSSSSSEATAYGVFKGLEAAVHFLMNRQDLKGLKVVIQGVGNVGEILAKYLKDCGAELFITDINKQNLERVAKEFDATIVAPEDIYSVKCDVFAPCAYGRILNKTNIDKLDCKIIAGAANNQLETIDDAELVAKKGIIYVPDYVLSAGGVIYSTLSYLGNHDQREIRDKIANIYNTVTSILKNSQQTGLNPALVADRLAQEKLK